MSILHDSLQRYQHSAKPGTGSTAPPWGLADPPESSRTKGLFTRKTWLLLGGLTLFSLGAWGIVQMWPVTGAHHARTSSGQDTGVAFRASLDTTAPEKGPVHAPHSTHQPAVMPATSSAPLAQDFAASELQEDAHAVLPNRRTLEELNSRLATLLAVLDEPFDAARSRTLEGDEGELETMAIQDRSEPPDDTPAWTIDESAQGRSEDPEVQIFVQTSAAPSDVGDIRRLEEELGQALRARNWAAFDLAYERLARLNPQAGDTRAHWQAARLMAGKDYPGAQRILELLHSANPLDPRTGLNLAMVHEAQGQIDEARNIARALARHHPLDTSIHALLDRLENRRRK